VIVYRDRSLGWSSRRYLPGGVDPWGPVIDLDAALGLVPCYVTMSAGVFDADAELVCNAFDGMHHTRLIGNAWVAASTIPDAVPGSAAKVKLGWR
jgi:hypothetical protein